MLIDGKDFIPPAGPPPPRPWRPWSSDPVSEPDMLLSCSFKPFSKRFLLWGLYFHERRSLNLALSPGYSSPIEY